MEHTDLETLRNKALLTHSEHAVDYVFDGLASLDDLPYVRMDIEQDKAAFAKDEITSAEYAERIALCEELSALRKSGVKAQWAWAKQVWSYA